MAGIAPRECDPAACKTTLIANLKYAAQKLAEHDITLLLEAINTRDMPGFFVSTQAESFAICAEVNAPNLKMQMDCYHMQVMEGDLARKLRHYAPHCGHIQIAVRRRGGNRIRVKSVMSIYSVYWMRSGMTAGWAASIDLPTGQWMAWDGSGRCPPDRQVDLAGRQGALDFGRSDELRAKGIGDRVRGVAR